MGKKLEDQVFDLKFASKSLARQSKKCEKEEKSERTKVKKAIEKGNHEGARIYAQNAIRKRSEAMNCLRLASRVDAVASRLESALRMGAVSSTMQSIVKTMGSALDSMNLEKVTTTMDSFEKQFENLDVRSAYMEDAMGASTALTTPEDEVAALIQQVADEHHLELKGQLDMPVSDTAPAQPQAAEAGKGKEPERAAEEDDLMARLNQLKNNG
jgi:charged multivesicular body protein 1